MRAVEREDQSRERGGFGFGVGGLVEGTERGSLGDVKMVILGGSVMAS